MYDGAVWFYTERPGWAVAVARVGEAIDSVKRAGSRLKSIAVELVDDVVASVEDLRVRRRERERQR
jgi:hypothetical protein